MKQPGKPERREQGLRSILVVLGIIFLLSYMIRDSLRVSVMVQVIDKDSQLHSPTMITLSSSSSSTPERTPPTRGIEEPISCYSFLQEARSKNSTIVDANGGLMHVNFTQENPGFWISLHNEATDKVRWKPIVELGRYYERDLVRIWDKVLQKAPQGSRVLDVGGNIGYYSLFSASRGPFAIDTFEPAGRNVMRMCEAVLLNKWMNQEELGGSGTEPSIDIHPIGLSDRDGVSVFYEIPSSPGSGSFAAASDAAIWFRMPGPGRAGMKHEIPVMKLDTFAEKKGWFESKPNIEVMKIDVEGHGANVILGGRKLLRSGLVQNIFTETSYHKDNVRDRQEMAAVKLLIDTGYKLAGVGGWLGPGDANPWENDENLVENIFRHMKESPNNHHKYLNLWWSLKYDKEW